MASMSALSGYFIPSARLFIGVGIVFKCFSIPLNIFYLAGCQAPQPTDTQERHSALATLVTLQALIE